MARRRALVPGDTEEARVARDRAQLRWLIDAYAAPLDYPKSCPWMRNLAGLAGPPISVEAGILVSARPPGAGYHELVTVDSDGYVHRLAGLPSDQRNHPTKGTR